MRSEMRYSLASIGFLMMRNLRAESSDIREKYMINLCHLDRQHSMISIAPIFPILT